MKTQPGNYLVVHPLHLQQCQVIRHVELHHFGGDDSNLRDQPHLRPEKWTP